MNPFVRVSLCLALVAALAGLAAPPVHAQVTTGSIGGQVVSAVDGTALPGAAVTLTHVPTNTTFTVTSGDEGRFQVPNLRVGGPYTVHVDLDAFAASDTENVMVPLGDTVWLRITLDPEGVSEEITVTETLSPLINPNRMGSQTSASDEEIEAKPTVRRNVVIDVAVTNPYASVRASDENQKDISFAGRSSKYNNIQIDGSNYNDLFGLGESGGTPAGQTNAQPIQQDVVQELQVALSTYDVRQGGFTGGAINAVTRSGTNDLHGSAYYAQRDPDYVGDGPFDTPIREFDEEQIGASLGGFLVRDTAWYFVAGETNERSEPSGFSADGSTGQVFSKPEDAARFRDILINRYGYDPGGLGDIAIATESDHLFGRVDWNVTDGNQLTLRHNYVDSFRDDVANRSFSVFRFPKATFSRTAEVNATVLQLNSLFSSNLFNEARIGFQTLDDERAVPEAFPSVEVGGTGPRRGELLAGTEQFSGLNKIEQEVLEIHDDLTYLLGDHTITIGTHNEFFDITNFFLASFYGYYYFPTLDALEAGVASEFQISFSAGDDPGAASSVFEVQQYGLYAGDQWRVSNRLSFTYGLRADYALLPDEPTFNPAIQAELGVNNSNVPDDNLILSPRVGFNWDPTGEANQQVRGGLGIFSGRAPYVWISNVYAGTGIATLANTVRGAIPFNPDPFNQPQSGTGGTTVDLIDPDFEFPRVLRGNLAYDRELPWWNLSATGELLYTQTEEDIYYVNLNRVQTGTNPLDGRPTYARRSSAFADAPLLTNTGIGEEVAASIVVRRRAADGLGFIGGYTWMDSNNAFDGTSSRAISNWQFHPTRGDIFEPEESTSSWENEHRFWLNASYRFDTGRVGHTLGMYYNAESGRPYSILMGGDPNRDGFSTNDLLYVPASQDEVILQGFTWEQFLNYLSENDVDCTGCILERNDSEGPWVRRLDFHYGLDVPISRVRAQVSLDILNLINLFDSDKGVVEFVPFGTTTPITTSVDAATGGTIYRQNFTNSIVNTESPFSTSDTLSRWQARLGLRVSF